MVCYGCVYLVSDLTYFLAKLTLHSLFVGICGAQIIAGGTYSVVYTMQENLICHRKKRMLLDANKFKDKEEKDVCVY